MEKWRDLFFGRLFLALLFLLNLTVENICSWRKDKGSLNPYEFCLKQTIGLFEMKFAWLGKWMRAGGSSRGEVIKSYSRVGHFAAIQYINKSY